MERDRDTERARAHTWKVTCLISCISIAYSPPRPIGPFQQNQVAYFCINNVWFYAHQSFFFVLATKKCRQKLLFIEKLNPLESDITLLIVFNKQSLEWGWKPEQCSVNIFVETLIWQNQLINNYSNLYAYATEFLCLICVSNVTKEKRNGTNCNKYSEWMLKL